LSTIIDLFKSNYFRAATHVWFGSYNPLMANTYVYNSSGGTGATAGQKECGQYGVREIYYRAYGAATPPATVTIGIEGRHAHVSTWTDILEIATAASMAKYRVAPITENVDFLRVGLKAQGATTSRKVNIYGAFK
jgi:hypothetical protein